MSQSPRLRKPDGFVNCVKDRYNLRPAVAEIMAMENWILDRIPQDQKLVIIVGELHNQQTHLLLQQALVLEHLRRRSELPFEFGMEADPVHVLKLCAKNQSVQALHDTCAEHDISIGCNDVTRINTNSLFLRPARIDIDDERNQKYARKFKLDLTKIDRRFSSEQAMAFRNSVIVANAIDHIKKTEARIYIQNCGMRHVVGGMSSHDENSPYTDSLTAKFIEKGFAVLSVMPDTENEYFSFERDLTDDAIPRSVRAQTVRVHGLFGGEKGIPYFNVRGTINHHSEYNLR